MENQHRRIQIHNYSSHTQQYRRHTGNDHYPHTNKGEILGITFPSTGIHNHIIEIKAVAETNLTNRFRNLNIHNKRKLYISCTH